MTQNEFNVVLEQQYRKCADVLAPDIQVTSAPGEDSAYLSQGEGVISSIISAADSTAKIPCVAPYPR